MCLKLEVTNSNPNKDLFSIYMMALVNKMPIKEVNRVNPKILRIKKKMTVKNKYSKRHLFS